jgi:hypothetical protein
MVRRIVALAAGPGQAAGIVGDRLYLGRCVKQPSSLTFLDFWLREWSGTIGTTGTLERLEPALA